MGNQYKQLTLKERYQIEVFSKLEFSARNIANRLGRSNKTISNELARCTTNQYCAETAHHKALRKRSLAGKYLKCTQAHSEAVKSALVLGLSPEQISGRMKVEKTLNSISCGTVYQ